MRFKRVPTIYVLSKKYGMWRALTGKHKSMEYSMMEAGHTVSSRLAFWAVEGRSRVTLRDLIFSKIQQLHL